MLTEAGNVATETAESQPVRVKRGRKLADSTPATNGDTPKPRKPKRKQSSAFYAILGSRAGNVEIVDTRDTIGKIRKHLDAIEFIASKTHTDLGIARVMPVPRESSY